MHFRHILVLAAHLLLLPSALVAQSSVEAEQQVRIHAPDAGIERGTIGTVLDVKGDTLVLQTTGYHPQRVGMQLTQRNVPLSSIESLEVPTGTQNRLQSSIVGAVIGTGLGALAATVDRSYSLAAFDQPPCPSTAIRCREVFPAYPGSRSVAITVTGTALGTVAGYLWPGRRWRRVNPYAPQAAIDADGNVHLSGTVRF
jgi:hypothetical protein